MQKGLVWAAGYVTGARLEDAHLLGGVTAMEAWEQVRIHKIQTTSVGSLDCVGSVRIDHTIGLVGSHHSEMDTRVCCATLRVSGVCVLTHSTRSSTIVCFITVHALEGVTRHGGGHINSHASLGCTNT